MASTDSGLTVAEVTHGCVFEAASPLLPHRMRLVYSNTHELKWKSDFPIYSEELALLFPEEKQHGCEE